MLSEIIKSSQADLAEIAEHSKKIDDHTKAPAIKKSYRSDWNAFINWCDTVDLCSHPAEPDTIRLYVAYLDKVGRKPSTIKRAITSIRQAHTLAGVPSPITEAVRETCKGVFRLRGILTEKKSALTVNHLNRLLDFIPPDTIGTRDRALILTGWTGGLRRSEIVSINYEDLDHQTEGFAITIRRSKIDQQGAGKLIGLPFVDNNEKFCAARAIQKWILIARIKSGPIFRRIGRGGRNKFFYKSTDRLSDKQVNRIVKGYAEAAGYNPILFGAHSLRSGLATTLASIGIDERRIMQITGHRSLKILREYIERGELFHEHPILSIFSGQGD